MVGSLADAEDIVQDTFMKWLTIDHQKIQNTKAYLVKSVTNNCINHLNTLMRKKEECLDHLNLGELAHRYIDVELPKIDVETEIAAALAVVHKKLAPLERAIFLLREIFEVEYEDLQLMFDKKKDNCRQIFSRAKDKLSQATIDIKIDISVPSNILQNFTDACTLGAPAEFLNDLKKDVTSKLSPSR
jgi:RNA polymerase sigma-70 factor (ECF subfamily)